MKITVTNDSPNRLLLVTRRSEGVRTQDTPIEPMQARAFTIDGPNTALSFAAGPVAESAAAPAAPPAAPVDQGAPAATQQPPAATKPRSWNETRSLARKLGAPQNVTKADAEALIAQHEAAQAAKATAA